VNEVARVYGLQSSPIRRFSAFSFSIVLALDGVLRTFGDAIIPHHHGGLWLQMYSLIDYGPLNIFSAALLATDGASVLYYNHTALQVAKALRLLYPLLNASLFLSLLLSRSVVGFYRGWIALRLFLSMLWFCSCLYESLGFGWKEPEEPERIKLPGVNIDDGYSSSADDDSDRESSTEEWD